MSQQPLFTLSYDFTPALRRQAAFELTKISLRGRIGLIYLACMALLSLGFAVITYNDTYDLTESIISGLPFVIIMVAFAAAIYGTCLYRLREASKKFSTLHFEFYDDYLINRTTGTEGKVDYSVLDQLITTKAGRLIRLHRQYIFLPSAQVTAELGTFLEAKLRPAAPRSRA
ncbi:MAG TPA: hypothetical protein VLF67_02625 [Candidatus Saccharimonas sp.]|nr:hypothetical protein [Candidatus Saccharimonas sp.]